MVAETTDKTVLAPYWMFADRADLEKALQSIQFELHEQDRRAGIAASNKEISEARSAEIRKEIDAINAEFSVGV